ncbi:hypothetical protein SY83_19095 [Paenibacillus swuensis]|uniref:Glucosyl-3-phosphoglycerate synthase n=1 Tax=Paenibacillus swuensis TaxID=1178515 RepID=A0A172TLZ3_9BACL|nr:glycosyltransferase family 2 protein [Paenibacillus swuensis]ANE48050.1 hypothetical protein SY83_19095 [Paenibacillus swuensis]
MSPIVSVIIPAWNESERISATLRALHRLHEPGAARVWHELIVVDDGSEDETFRQALPWANHVLVSTVNLGKGSALQMGVAHASGDIIVFLDADLEESAAHLPLLLAPVLSGEADMAVAKLPSPSLRGGFGLVKGLAAFGIRTLCGFQAAAPLSGQRALRREVIGNGSRLANRFGIEVGLTIDAARAGYRICEVDVPFKHRETGRDWSGFVHRGRQFVSVGRTLLLKWMFKTQSSS